jgi:hypothetical protein
MKPKDQALVDYIISNTENGKLRWEATAYKHQFLAALRGQFTAMIERQSSSDDNLYLRNSSGDIILRITASEDPRIDSIFELARRNAYNVDAAIDEILASGDEPKGVEDEDIPL